MEHLMTNFGIPFTVLINIGTQFTSKFFAALCQELSVKIVCTIEYRPLVKEEVERFNATKMSRVWLCLSVLEKI